MAGVRDEWGHGGSNLRRVKIDPVVACWQLRRKVAPSAENAADAPALLLVDDVADAAFGTAAAGVQTPFGVGETVIEGEFFAGSDFATGNDPDVSANVVGAAVWRTGMVNQTGDVARRAAVEIVLFVEIKNINAVVAATFLTFEALFFAPLCFGFCDACAGVLDHARAVGNIALCIDATAVNRGVT